MTEIARGEIHVEVNDEGAMAQLRRLDNEFERAMQRIDRQSATVDIKANVKDLEQKLKQADKALADAARNRQKAQADGDEHDRRSTATILANAKKRAAALRAELDDAKRLGAARLKNYQDEERAARREAVLMATRAKAYRIAEQAQRRAIAANRQLQRAAEQQVRATDRETVAVVKLQREYDRLNKRIESLTSSRRRASRENQRSIDLDLNVARRELEVIERNFERRGIEIPVKFRAGEFSGNFIRESFDRGGLRGAANATGIALGVTLAGGVERGIRNAGPNLLKAVQNMGSRLANAVDSLSEATVRIGPFTTTIKTAIKALSLLGPAILGVAGAAASLGAAAGAAALGTAALGGAFLAGFVPAAIGAFAVLKPLVGEFGNAMKASEAYNQAVLKNGRGSDQAAKKLEELNNVLKGQSKDTRRAFVEAGKLRDAWANATSSSRRRAFESIGEGLTTASELMDNLASGTNRSFEVAGDSIDRWARGLRSVEGQHLFDKIFGNFNASLGPILDGLGNIGTYLGRVFGVASEFLPGIANTFERWSQRLAGGAANTDVLRQKIERLVGASKTFGNFLLSAGRLLRTVFGQGVESGVGLLESMTNAMDRWRVSVAQSGGAGDFFRTSANSARALASVLGPLVATFFQWAEALAPIGTLFFTGAGYAASFARSLLSVTALHGPLSALVTTLGALWAVGRIRSAAAAVSAFSLALLGLGRAQTAAAGAGAARGAGLGLGAVAAAGAAGRAGAVASQMSKGAKAAGLLRGALTGVGAALGIANPLFGAAALGIGAAAFAFVKLRNNSRTAKDALAEAGVAAGAAAQSYRTSAGSLADLTSDHARANIAVRAARAELRNAKKGTDEYKLALLNLRDAERYAAQSGQALTDERRNMVNASAEQVAREEDRLEAFDKANEATRGMLEAEARLNRGTKAGAAAQGALNDLLERREAIVAGVNRAMNRQAAVAANVARANAHLSSVTGKAEQQLGRLAATRPNLAVKIATRFEAPKDVGRVAAAAQAALGRGVTVKTVMRVIADSKDVDDTIDRLKAQTIPSKTVGIDANDKASGKAAAAAGAIRSIPGKTAKIDATDGASGKAKTATAFITSIPDAIARLTAIDNASGPARNAASAIDNVRSKTVTLTTVYQIRGSGPANKAQGGPVTPEERRLRAVLGRDPAEAALPTYSSSKGRKVNRPTLLTGEENRTEFVIATNPQYRKSNLGYLKMAARALGVDMAYKGKAPRKPRFAKGSGGDIDRMGPVKRVEELKQAEDNKQREVSIEESKVREPDTFLKAVGADAEGNPIYEVDQNAIAGYMAQLERVKAKMNELLGPDGIVSQLVAAIDAAVSSLVKGPNSYVGKRNFNIKELQETIRVNERILKSGAPKDTKEKAKDRIADAKRMMADERDKRQRANDKAGTLGQDRTDAEYRRQEYTISRGDLQSTMDAVVNKANADRDAQNPRPTTPDAPAPPEPLPSFFETEDARLAAELSLAEAGLGGRPVADILNEQRRLEGSRISDAYNRLGDADPYNDVGAYNDLATAGGAIRAIDERLGTLPGSPAYNAGQVAGYNAARSDLYSQFGSNAFGSLPSGRSVGPSYGPSSPALAGAGTSVTVNNHYQAPPPDPHTWSKQLGYELQAL